MNVLLSIKPRYVEAILKGDKRYEFRKNIFRNKDVENVYIYATAPVKKLVGFFKVGNILEDHPVCLWDRLQEFSGLDEKEFFSYFGDNKRGFAIEILSVAEFLNPLDPRDFIPRFAPPQSFCYLDIPIVTGEQAWR